MTQSKAFWCLCCLALIYVVHGAVYGGWTWSEAMFNAQYDSRGYRQIGEGLWSGTGPPFDRLAQRGYLYPAVAVGLTLISPGLLFFAQAFAVCAGLWCLLATEQALAGRIIVTPFALVSVSLLLSPSHLMTEAFAFGLSAFALLLFVRGAAVWPGIAILVAAACVKPAFFPAAFVGFAVGILRRRDIVPTLLAAFLIVGPQLVLTAATGGTAVLSTAASDNFTERFYPAVAGTVEGLGFVTYRSEAAIAARALRPELREQVGYVLKHPNSALRTWGAILWEQNLTQPSGYLQKSNGVANSLWKERLSRLSRFLNTLLLAMLLPSLAGAVVFLREMPARRWIAPFLGLTLIAASPLTYFQGDRIIFGAVVLMLPFAGIGLRRLSRRAASAAQV